MSLQDHALYQIATKAILYNNGKILILYTPDGYVDFPGGRVDESERELSWQDALRREIAEELGNDITVSIGRTLFVSKRQYHKNDATHYVAAIYFECQLESGEIALSDEHVASAWIEPSELFDGTKKFVSEDEYAQLSALLAQ